MRSRKFTFLLALAAILVGPLANITQAEGTNETPSFDYRSWGLLAIQEGGRRKPMDTFAKETLLRLSGLSSWKTAERVWPANEFVLSMLLQTHEWSSEPLVLIGYRPLVEKLGLDPAKKRYSFEELSKLDKLQVAVKEMQETRRASKELTRMQKEVETVETRLALFGQVASGAAFTVVPSKKGAGAHWLLPSDVSEEHTEKEFDPALTRFRDLAKAYVSRDAFNFSLNSTDLRTELRKLSPNIYPSDMLLKVEFLYNHLDPFYWAMVLYLTAFLILLVANAKTNVRGGLVSAIGIASTLGGVGFHCTGIVMRCIIAGRPPVTNMYESVVWVSFGVMVFGFAFFLRYRALTYLLAALPVSFICLVLLRQLPVAMPESIDPLVPVLRSNFWLTIHVLTITLSYAAFALAMGFGHIVLYRYIRNPNRTEQLTALHFWLYRVIQLGVLLLAAGTILGGVWANYSWGRFWGWDPKETWALIALLCYIVVLHGRIAGWWDHFGLAVASVICFCAVVMTWYGVNFVLGKGLHSYGFGIGGEGYVTAFVILDLLYVALACVRKQTLRAEGLMQKVES